MAANNRSLTKLPNLSFEAVLLKLPLPSLFICCCVSKSLSDLIKSDSGFARAHFAKSEPQLMIEPIWHARCHLIDFDSDLDFTTAARVVVKPSFNLPMRFFRITNSCNGLLLLERVYTDQDFHQCLVYNPVTGEYIMIPETVYPCLNVTCAFFYSPISNQFQILRVFHRLSPDPDVELDSVPDSGSDSDSDPHSVPDLDINSEDSGIDYNSYSGSDSDSDSDSDTVYSVSDAIGELFVTGSDSWESVGNVPFSPLSIYSSCHLSNSTHWLCADENVENIIVFFSFSTRQIGEIVGPTCISKAHANAHENMALLVFDNCLTIFDGLLTKGKIEVWKMGEYGVVESWSRVFVIDTMLFRAHGLYNCFRPVMFRNNGEVVMVSASRFMVVYNMVEKKGRIVNHPPLLLPLNVVVHTPSFISLRNVVRGNSLEVLTVASRFVDEELDEFNYLELTRTFSEEAD